MADNTNIRVLLVEDDQFNRKIMEHLFQVMGIRHDEAVDGEEAIRLAEEKNYDLILMDINMPVMDGYTATRRIRKLPGYQDKTIIALTADICEKVKQEVNSGLFTDFKIKPVDPGELQQKIIQIAKNQFPEYTPKQ
jgi:CheY-like chemotaxis protein